MIGNETENRQDEMEKCGMSLKKYAYKSKHRQPTSLLLAYRGILISK